MVLLINQLFSNWTFTRSEKSSFIFVQAKNDWHLIELFTLHKWLWAVRKERRKSLGIDARPKSDRTHTQELFCWKKINNQRFKK